MNRLFRIVKPILLYLAVPIVIAGISFTSVGAEGETTAASLGTSSPSIVEAEPELTYTYNEATGLWDSNAWHYDPVLGSYQPVVPVSETADEVLPAVEPWLASNQDDGSPEPILEETANNVADINNTIESGATTGDASVLANTEAGSAESGDASSTATVLNNINSVTDLSGSGGSVATFSADIVGNVSGDIVLQPIISQAFANPTAPNETVTNLTTLNSITNDINLNANSGDATVEKNTKAGDALTGSAETVANIINVVNSMVVAGQSFIGAINIYGNFIGNILISPDFIPQLLASNSGNDSVLINASDTVDIINNLSLNATSGRALIDNNTQAGNAVTGNALTNVEIFNMTSHDIIASNCLLVFINVLGEWYGIIVDAPVGATAAMIGSGIESNNVSMPNVDSSTDTKVEIINNITLNSQSGDASVLDNTIAGNAVSGDATASVNLANIVGSRFSLSGWFGLLFINVFGKWFGNFGIEEKSTTPIINDSNGGVAESVIEFVPKENNLVDYQTSNIFVTTVSDDAEQISVIENISDSETKGSVLSVIDERPSAPIDYIFILIIAMLIMMVLSILWLGIQRIREMRRA